MQKRMDLTIEDPDRKLTIELTAGCEINPGCRGDRITPGEAPFVEVCGIIVNEIVTWIGDYGVRSKLAELDSAALRAINVEIGETYKAEIHAAAMAACDLRVAA